jgi:hypothetical protein
MASVRTIVRRQMKAKGWTSYRLAKELRGKVPTQTVYNFVKNGRAINSKSLDAVLVALGLEVRPKCSD